MRSQLTIENTDHCLVARVKASTDYWRIVGSIAGAALLVFLISRAVFQIRPIGLTFFSLIITFSILREIIHAVRGTEVELTVWNLDFVSTGHAPGGYVPCQVSRDDLLRLEFRSGSGGGEDPELPKGLYVEYNSESAYDTRVCVLPHISEEQTKEVIDAIRRQFPEIDEITYTRPAKSGLISLNLNR